MELTNLNPIHVLRDGEGAVLAEDLSFVLGTHEVAHNCYAEASHALFWSPWTPGMCVMLKYTSRQNTML